jgi:hypothetical protein
VHTFGDLSSAVSGGVLNGVHGVHGFMASWLHGILPVTAEALKWPANSAVLSCSRSRIRGNPSLRALASEPQFVGPPFYFGLCSVGVIASLRCILLVKGDYTRS